MTERFNKAYQSLVKAFYNDTLAKGTCTACAVGNIVADAMGEEVRKHSSKPHLFICDEYNDFWGELFRTGEFGQIRTRDFRAEQNLLKLTNYSANELAKVEYAFETNTNIMFTHYHKHSKQEIINDQFNGLKAVVEVLLELDNLSDEGHIKHLEDRLQLV